MATRMYVRSASTDPRPADIIRGTNTADSAGTASAWRSGRFATTAGASAAGTSIGTTSTVTGPTNGVDTSSPFGGRAEWYSAPLAADITISSTITFNIWASESNMNANVAINGVLERIDETGAIISTIARTARTVELGTSAAVNNFTVTPTSTNMQKGDRLRLRLFGDDPFGSTMAAGHSFIVYGNHGTGGASGDTWVEFTENLTFQTSDPAGTQIFLTTTAGPAVGSANEMEMWTSRGSGSADAVISTTPGGGTWGPPVQWTDTSGGTVIEWYTKQLTAFTLSGLVKVSVRARTSNTSSNGGIRAEIAVVNDDGSGAAVYGAANMLDATSPGVGVTVGGGTDGYGGLTVTDQPVRGYIAGQDISVTGGQRLRLRLFLINTLNSYTAGFTCTVTYAGTSGGASGDSWIQLEQSVTEFVAGTTGTAVGSLGALTGTVVGKVRVTGATVGIIGGLTGTASGRTTSLRGTAAGVIGGLTGTASGRVAVTGATSGVIGGLVGTAIGRRGLSGSAVGVLGGLVGTAQGRDSNQSGTGVGVIGGISGSATGARGVLGAGVGVLAAGAGDYPSTVLGDAPTGYYRFEETSGTVAADEVGSNDGTIIGSPTLGVPGAHGLAIDVSPNFTDRVSIPTAGVPNWLTEADFSVEAWVKTNDYGVIIGQANDVYGADSGYVPWLYVTPAGAVYCALGWRGATSVTTSGGVQIADGQWHHIVAVSSLTDREDLYIDGVLVGTRTTLNAKTSYSATYHYLIGNGRWNGWPDGGGGYQNFIGEIDEVAFYDTALTLAQVQTHFAGGSASGFHGEATGVVGVLGSTSGSLGGITGAATGTATGAPRGTGSGILGGLNGTAVGQRGVRGVTSGILGGITGTAVGQRGVRATAAGVIGGLSGSAVGRIATTRGTGAGTIGGLVGTASGLPGVRGAAVGVIGGLVGHASGRDSNQSGVGTGILGGLVGVASGRPGVLGATSGVLGGIIGTALGRVRVTGVTVGIIGGLNGTASGRISSLRGSGSGVLGGISGHATGIVTGITPTGTGVGVLGGLVGVATGVPGVRATAVGTLGGLAGVAVGRVRVTALAVGSLGGLSGTAGGRIAVTGAGASTFGSLNGTANGVRGVVALGTGQLGGLSGHASGVTALLGYVILTERLVQSVTLTERAPTVTLIEALLEWSVSLAERASTAILDEHVATVVTLDISSED